MNTNDFLVLDASYHDNKKTRGGHIGLKVGTSEATSDFEIVVNRIYQFKDVITFDEAKQIEEAFTEAGLHKFTHMNTDVLFSVEVDFYEQVQTGGIDAPDGMELEDFKDYFIVTAMNLLDNKMYIYAPKPLFTPGAGWYILDGETMNFIKVASAPYFIIPSDADLLPIKPALKKDVTDEIL